jgi:hypothetical protein
MQLIKIISGYKPGKRINIEQPTSAQPDWSAAVPDLSGQPQHVEKLCGIRHIPAGWFCEAAAAALQHSRAPMFPALQICIVSATLPR